MAKLKVKHKTKEEPVHPDLYQRAVIIIRALKGKWDVKKGKVVIKMPKSKKL